MDLLLVLLISLSRFRPNIVAVAAAQPDSSSPSSSARNEDTHSLINEQLANTSTTSSSPSGLDSNQSSSSTVPPDDTLSEEDLAACLNEDLDVELRIIEALLGDGYSKQILPDKNGTDVELEIHISDIPHISEIGSFFELDLFLSEVWEDKRLAFGFKSQTPATKCVKNMTLDLDYLQRLWTPNVCIVNSKSAVIHASPSENVFLILYRNGRMWKNCRMLVRAPCSIDLRNFPFDTQTCTLLFESYSYNSQKVRLQWMKEQSSVTLMKSMELADFTLVDYQTHKFFVEYPNGHWDQLKATFVFERRYGFFIWQAFVPSYMTVGVAYITFWMDPKELCTRATLAISAFLAICLQFGNVQQNQPRVSYIKAMDVWMLASILFMFGSLVELAIISYVCRQREKFFEANRKSSTSASPSSLRGVKANSGSHRRRTSNENGGGNGQFEWQMLSERDRDRMLQIRTENGIMSTPGSASIRSFRSLEENGAISGNGRTSNRRTGILTNWWPMHMMNGGGAGEGGRRISMNNKKRRNKLPMSAESVDKIFLCLYPPVFLIFNLIFWWWYLPHAFW